VEALDHGVVDQESLWVGRLGSCKVHLRVLSQLAWEHLRPKIDGDEDRKRYTEDP
jgi:hypothetical protein